MELWPGHVFRYVCTVILTLEIWHWVKLWPGYGFWVCVYCDIDLGDLTWGQGHHTPLGHVGNIIQNRQSGLYESMAGHNVIRRADRQMNGQTACADPEVPPWDLSEVGSCVEFWWVGEGVQRLFLSYFEDFFYHTKCKYLKNPNHFQVSNPFSRHTHYPWLPWKSNFHVYFD